MSFNQTPSSNRVHIGFFGRRNAGKSSVVNAVTGQELAVVSEIKGTTTDPVQKAMELLPLGPAVIIDTPGIDDEGALGELRIKKTRQILNKTDVAVLVVDIREGKNSSDEALLALFKEKEIPYLVVYNKADLLADTKEESVLTSQNENQTSARHLELSVSAKTKEGIQKLKECLASLAKQDEGDKRIAGDLVNPSDFVVLVTPIDKAAPKGRLILPQQQTIRDLLEADAVTIVVKEDRLKETLRRLGQAPKLVITDSQVFAKVARDTPKEVLLTSFSILFARYKGNLPSLVRGAAAIGKLKDKDQVLISEGCTHHRQCDDIGSVKLPGWLKEYTGKELTISFSSGTEFPENLKDYGLVIHCGGCMLNEREMKYRLKCAEDAEVPMTNYGIAIAFMKGILRRSLEVFPEVLSDLEPNKNTKKR